MTDQTPPSRTFAERAVLIAGDTHGDMQQVNYLLDMARQQGITRIVQVGDFGYWPHIEPFHERVNKAAMRNGIDWYWLDGNHENFDALQEAVDFDADTPQQMLANLWYLPRGCIWEWEGCRFMALGGAYSIDKAYRREGHSWWSQELLTREQVERAMDRGGVDVMLTHDAPEGVCPIVTGQYKGDEISRGNRKAITAVVEAVHPALLVHGHYHHRYSATMQDGPQVIGLGRDGDALQSWVVIDPPMWTPHNAPAKPSVDAVEGHGVHEHVYRCQDCGLVESDVLSDERLAANADSAGAS